MNEKRLFNPESNIQFTYTELAIIESEIRRNLKEFAEDLSARYQIENFNKAFQRGYKCRQVELAEQIKSALEKRGVKL